MRGLKTAIDYLNAFPVSLVPETLHKRAGCLDVMATTLAHSLRRAARAGKVAVEYLPDSRGVMIAHYKALPK
jgi:hypothetical protein